MIEFSGVSHRYEAHAVLREISVTLSERRVAIVGGNGSGKSTFARLLNGLQVPTEGSVKIDGLDTKTDGKEVRKRVGFVFQNPDNQIVFPVVEEDLAFGLKNLRIPKKQIKSKIESMLERYDLSSFREHPSHLLSGGQKQLLAICGVLIMEPKYIVFDEPTTLLDLRNKRRISEAIAELDQSAIVVSHDLDFLKKFDRVLVFDGGRIIIDDEPSSALARYVESMT